MTLLTERLLSVSGKRRKRQSKSKVYRFTIPELRKARTTQDSATSQPQSPVETVGLACLKIAFCLFRAELFPNRLVLSVGRLYLRRKRYRGTISFH
jgi:hypothetical protein